MIAYSRNIQRVLVLALMLSMAACVTVDGTEFKPGFMINAARSSDDVERAKAACKKRFASGKLAPIRDKMVLDMKTIPTSRMLQMNEAPNDDEIMAIKYLEESSRSCRKSLADAGYPTSAMEDIMEARVSHLRRGLFQGEIPFAVYNYGIVKAMKEQAKFDQVSERAYARGAEIGKQKALAAFQQQQQRMQMNDLQNRFDNYQRMDRLQGWNCTARHTYGDNYNVTCN